MAHNGATKTKEEMTRHQPRMDVMVATFADRQAAKDAYKTLRSMDKDGAIELGGAFVIDRDEMGRMHLEGAKLPNWLVGLMLGWAVVMAGLIGAIVWLGIMAARGMRARREDREAMSTEYSV